MSPDPSSHRPDIVTIAIGLGVAILILGGAVAGAVYFIVAAWRAALA